MHNTKDIQKKLRAAGVVGAGGAGFPTYVKFGAKADIFLVNAAECEPLLKVDQQLMVRHANLLIRGLELGMQSTGATEGIIALKPKYTKVIEAITPFLSTTIRLHILKDIYPAGDEVITIWMATGRRVPPAKLPLDVGVVVNNPQTLINVALAIDEAHPVIFRTVTVGGAVKNPITLTVPIGTSFLEMINMAGGPTIANAAYVEGGPMMGNLVDDLKTPVTKTTGGIIALPEDHIIIRRHRQPIEAQLRIAKTTCEQCCLCTELCPRHIIGHELPPHLIVRAINYSDIASPSVLLSALTCSECNICEAWACPVDISPMRLNRLLKAKFRAEGGHYQGELRDMDPMAEHRLLPTSRLIARLAVEPYNREAPLDDAIYQPSYVTLNLDQHIGTPATPIVKKGDKVFQKQCIAEVPEEKLGVSIHASINGIVDSVTTHAISIRQA